MRKLLIAATLVASLTSTVASAQEVFSGVFVGLQAGPGRRTIDAYAIDQHRIGLDYGAFVGADLRIGSRFVVGAEGDIGDGGRTLTRTFANVGPTRADPGRNWSVTGRAGVLATPQLLVYARAGYGEERLRATFSNSTPSLMKSTPDGTVYGGGVEYALRQNISVRAEYRYSDFDGSYNPQQALLGIAFRF